MPRPLRRGVHLCQSPAPALTAQVKKGAPMITEPGPRTGADDVTQPIPRVRPRRWFRLNWITALVVVWAGLAAYNLHGGLPGAVSGVARARPVTHRHAERGVPATFPPAV